MQEIERKVVNVFLVGLIIISGFSTVLFITVDASSVSNAPQWPDPRGDAGHTGLSSQNTSENYGNVAWKFGATGAVTSSAVIASNGDIYFMAGSYLYCLNRNGTPQWRDKVESSSTQPSIGPDGTVYFADSRSIHAILPDGSEKWHFDLNYTASYVSDVLVSSEGVVYVGVVSGKTGHLYAIDSSGALLWTFERSFNNDNFYMHKPVIAEGPDGRIYTAFASYADLWGWTESTAYEDIFILSETGSLSSVDRVVNYGEGWDVYYYADIMGISISKDSTIYTVSSGDFVSVHAISNNGVETWNLTVGFMAMAYPDEPSIALSPEGGVYFCASTWGEQMSGVYYLNQTGDLIWQYKMDVIDHMSECSVGSDGSIYVAAYSYTYDDYSGNTYSEDRLTLYSINPDGSARWKTRIADYSYDISGPSIGNNGTVYIGLGNAYFYAIGGASTPPQNLTATSGRGYVDLKWEPPEHSGTSPVVSYNIYRCNVYDYGYYDDYYDSGDSCYSNVLVDTVPASILEYHDITVTNSETYSYYVTAVNNYESTESNTVYATPEGVPTGPLNLKAVSGGTNVSLSWEAPEDNGGHQIKYYCVYRGTIAGGEKLIKKVSGSYDYDYWWGEESSWNEPATTYIDEGVKNGVTYYYYITAGTTLGEGDASRIVTATPTSVPSPPVYLKVTAGDGYVNLTWQAPNSNGGSVIQKYRIYAGTVEGEEIPIATVSTYARFYQDKSVSNGGTYYYYVTAINSVGESNRSNKVSAKPEEGLGSVCTQSSSSKQDNLITPALQSGIMLLIAAILIYMVFNRHTSSHKRNKIAKRYPPQKPVRIKKKRIKNPPIGR